jgi:hypothetical protein
VRRKYEDGGRKAEESAVADAKVEEVDCLAGAFDLEKIQIINTQYVNIQ